MIVITRMLVGLGVVSVASGQAGDVYVITDFSVGDLLENCVEFHTE